MRRTCPRCKHVNSSPTAGTLDACPKCGALYARAEQDAARSAFSWKHKTLFGCLLVLVPWWAYQETWGSSAKRRQSEASLNAALTTQREQAREEAAKAHQARIQSAIQQGRLQVGMTADQVRAAWGEPTSVNRTVTERNTHEQWVYRQRTKTDYVYMDGGVVRSFQVSD